MRSRRGSEEEKIPAPARNRTTVVHPVDNNKLLLETKNNTFKQTEMRVGIRSLFGHCHGQSS